MADFSFPAWYVRMGYTRHGGQKACAEDLGLTDRHVRYLVKEGGTPGDMLISYCLYREQTAKHIQWLEEKLGRDPMQDRG